MLDTKEVQMLCFSWRETGWYGTWLPRMPRNCLCLLAIWNWVLNSLAHSVTRFLNPCPFKSRVVEQLFPLDWKAKSRYCRWSQELVASGLFVLERVFHGWGVAYNKLEGEQPAWRADVLKIPMQFMKFQSHCPLYSECTQCCVGPTYLKDQWFDFN